MTAICAYWTRDGAPHAADAVRRMAPALAIYGRDRYTEWSDGAVAMAIHQHHGLPEDVCDREPEYRDGVVFVADLRLDNRDDLCRDLGLDRVRWAGAADSAFVRAAWQRWGTECVHHLIGEFAFALWSDDRQTLFCARDPLGGRPLCYATVDRALAVASMPNGILALPEVSREPDTSTLAAHLVLLPPEDGRSHFRDVSLLPPGHTLTATAGRIHVQRYWHPRRDTEIHFRRDEDYVDRFLELFGAAVGARLRASGPIASTLSAGFDSGSVTAVAARQLASRGERLTAVTWTPGLGPHISPTRNRIADERYHAAAVAALYPNIDHVLVEGRDAYPLSLLPAFDNAAGQPFLNPITLPILRATGDRLAERGCGVLLTGQFGNMTISYDGLTLLPTLFRRGRWLRGVRESTALARAPSWSILGVLSVALGPALPVSLVRTLHRCRRAGGSVPLAMYPINPALATRHDVTKRAERLGFTRVLGSEHDGWHARMRTIRRFDLGMLVKGIHATLGVEFRDPTADVRILDYCLSIPETQFLRDGRTRWLIRRAMRGLLPPVVLDEPRRGVQGADWPRLTTPHRAAFAADLRDVAASPFAREIVDVPALGRLLDQWPAAWTERNVYEYSIKLPRGLATGSFILRHFT